MRCMLVRLLALLGLMVATGVVSSYGQAPSDKTAPPVPSGLSDDPLPGMPPVLDPTDIYSETRPDKVRPTVRDFPSRLYVPNSLSNTVDVIDPATSQIIESFPVGEEPQHVVPSYDLKTLWVLNNQGDSLT